MPYTKQEWENEPSTATAISAERLGYMEEGIETATETAESAEADAATNAAAVAAHLADGTDAHDASAVSFSPTGSIAATDVQAAIAEVASEAATAVTDHTGDTTAAHAASAVAFTPTGGLAATDVQTALAELDTEKAATSHTQASSSITDFTESVQDIVGDMVVEGSGINAVYNDSAGTLTLTASGGGGGGALPDGIETTDDYSGDAGVTVLEPETTTNWSSFNTTSALAADSSIFTTGTASVRCGLKVSAGNSYMRVNLAAPVSVGDLKWLAFDFYYSRTSGASIRTDQVLRCKAADGVDVSGTVAVRAMPNVPPTTWATVYLDVSALSEIESFGVFTDGGGLDDTTGAGFSCRVDNIRLTDNTELDAALDSDDEVAVIVSPTYASGHDQSPRDPEPGKTLLDLRPDSVNITRFRGDRHIRDWIGVAEDGLTDVSAQVQDVFQQLEPGDVLKFTPNATYWMDSQVNIADLRNVIIDFQGADIITRRFRGDLDGDGSNNTDDAILNFDDSHGVTLRNFRAFGYRPRIRTGAELTDYAGSPSTVSTTKTLDALNEAVRAADNNDAYRPFYARHPLIMFPEATRTLIAAYDPGFTFGNAFVANLSDSAGVASDCVIELLADEDPTVVLASRTLTLNGTPTDYVLTYEPPDIHRNYYVVVRKATATTNTITVHGLTEYGYTQYSSSHDTANVIQVRNSTDVVIEDWHIEGAATDAVDVTNQNNYRITVRRGISRCANRQGVSFNRGQDFSIEECEISEAGRSGIDVEPFATSWLVRNMTIRDIRMYNIKNYGIACANWACIEHMVIDNVEIYGAGVGLIHGGSRDGKITGLFGEMGWTQGPYRTSGGTVAHINGQNMVVDLRVDGDVEVGGSTKDHDGATYYPDGNVVRAYLPSGRIIDKGVGNQNLVENTASASRSLIVSSTAVTGADQRNHLGVNPDNRQFPFIHGFGREPGMVMSPGGLWMLDQAVMGVRGLSGRARTTGTLLSSSARTSSGTSSTVDLGVRGLSGVVRLAVTASSGTSPTLDVTVQGSMDNTNWYTIGTFRQLTTTGIDWYDLRFSERYLRLSYTIAGTSPSFTCEADFTYAVPASNLSGTATCGNAATSAAVSFTNPNTVGAHSSVTLTSNATAGSLTNSTTYYYRVGARTRQHGPKSWGSEQSVTTGASHTAVNLRLTNWYNQAKLGLTQAGFTVLRGTVSGTYTQRFDVLPKAGFVGYAGRHNISDWVDIGTAITPFSSFTGFPTTYPTPSPVLTVADESGWELNTSYGVWVTPSWNTTWWVDESANTRGGFTVNFGTAPSGDKTFRWGLVR